MEDRVIIFVILEIDRKFQNNIQSLLHLFKIQNPFFYSLFLFIYVTFYDVSFLMR